MSRPVAEIHETKEGGRFFFTCPSEYCDFWNLDPDWTYELAYDGGIEKKGVKCRGCGGKFAAKYMNDEESK